MKSVVKLEVPLSVLEEAVRSLDLQQKYKLVGILQQSIADDEREVPRHSEPSLSRYALLQDLLSAGSWREADEETAKILLNLTGNNVPGFIHGESLKAIPCEELKAIDDLWTKFSDGRFGFSAQERIWQDLGGAVFEPKQYEFHTQVENKFSKQIGWLRSGSWISAHTDFDFTIDAPAGHLPSFWCVGASGGVGNAIQRYHRFLLADKLISCNIK